MVALSSSATPLPSESTLCVGIAQCIVTKDTRAYLVSYGLGSCIGISMYDPMAQIGGLLHVLLPSPATAAAPTNPMRFATTGIPQLLHDIEQQGAVRQRLRVFACGGAQMLGALSTVGPMAGIGTRNADAVKQTLAQEGLRLAAYDFGGSSGRTIMLEMSTGITTVRIVGSPPRELVDQR